MTSLDLSRAGGSRELWRPGMGLSALEQDVLRCGSYRPGPVQHRRAASAPAWTFASLNSLYWYQDQATTDLAGTTPVASSTDSIALWKNRGSATADASQSSSTARPTSTVPSPLEVAFDGSDDLLTISGTPGLALSGAQWMVIRYRLGVASAMWMSAFVFSSGSIASTLILDSPSPGGSGGYPYLIAGLGISSGAATGWGFNPSLTTTYHTLLVEVSSTGVYTITYDNTTPSLVQSAGLAMAGGNRLGAYNSGQNQFYGRIKLLAGAAGTLSSSDKTNVLAYADAL